jgi:hypothetical protein
MAMMISNNNKTLADPPSAELPHVVYKLLEGYPFVPIRIQFFEQVLYLLTLAALKQGLEFSPLQKAIAIGIVVLEGISECVFKEETLAGVHGKQELVKIYLSGLVLVDAGENVPHLFLVLLPEVLPVKRHQLACLDTPVLVRIDPLENHSESLPFLLGDLRQREIVLDDGDEVIPTLVTLKQFEIASRVGGRFTGCGYLAKPSMR